MATEKVTVRVPALGAAWPELGLLLTTSVLLRNVVLEGRSDGRLRRGEDLVR